MPYFNEVDKHSIFWQASRTYLFANAVRGHPHEEFRLPIRKQHCVFRGHRRVPGRSPNVSERITVSQRG